MGRVTQLVKDGERRDAPGADTQSNQRPFGRKPRSAAHGIPPDQSHADFLISTGDRGAAGVSGLHRSAKRDRERMGNPRCGREDGPNRSRHQMSHQWAWKGRSRNGHRCCLPNWIESLSWRGPMAGQGHLRADCAFPVDRWSGSRFPRVSTATDGLCSACLCPHSKSRSGCTRRRASRRC